MIFKWATGDCMGRAYPASHKQFMELPVEAKLDVFQDLLDFFAYVAAQNYVAIDFYDGSILYDFETGKTTVCDIDFFRKQPTFNDMGRMWGSSRFQAPEEFRQGDVLDEVTNVYTLGATAFALFGEYERTRDKWQLNDRLFAIATKAVSAERNDRFASIAELQRSWMLELE
jgi:serine/threonine-protein kinase